MKMIYFIIPVILVTGIIGFFIWNNQTELISYGNLKPSLLSGEKQPSQLEQQSRISTQYNYKFNLKKLTGLEKYLIEDKSIDIVGDNVVIVLDVDINVYNWMKDAYLNPTMEKCLIAEPHIQEDYPNFDCSNSAHRDLLLQKLDAFTNSGFRVIKDGIDRGYTNVEGDIVTITIPVNLLLKKGIIELGENSLVYVYQEENQVVFSISDKYNVSAVLYWNNGTSFENQIDDIFVKFNQDKWKFGAEHNGTTWEQYKYVISSDATLENKNGKYYFRDGVGGYKILTNDICSKVDPLTNESASCEFNDYSITENNKTTYYLEITFYSDEFIDPSFTFENLDIKSTLEDLRFEGDNSTHLEVSAVAPYDSLVLYMPFDVNKSQATAYDYTNYDNDGTASGLARYTGGGIIGGAYKFGEGADDEITFTRTDELNFNGTKPFTIGFWINVLDGQAVSNDARIIQLENDLLIRFITGDNNKINFLMNDAGGNLNEPISLDTWNYVVGTYNGTTQKLYINGVNTDTATPAGQTVTSADWIIGKGNGGQLNGSLDELMMFNTALNSSQVLQIFNNQSARFKTTGTQEFKQTNLTLGTDNKVNLSISDFQNLMGTNISARVGYWNVSNGYNVSDDGLLAYFPFDDSFNSTNGLFNTTALGGTFSFNNSGVFDKSFHSVQTSYLGHDTLASAITGLPNFTVSLWLRNDITSTESDLEILDDGNTNFVLFWDNDNEEYQFTLDTTGDFSKTIISNDAITDNLFHHIVIFYNGSSNYMWVDGVRQLDWETFDGTVDDLGGLDIGYDWRGLIEDLIIFNIPLSDDEIKSLYVKGLANWNYTTSKNLTSSATPFQVPDYQTNYFPELTYQSGINNFYTPILNGNVQLDSWNQRAYNIYDNNVYQCGIIDKAGTYNLNQSIENYPATCITINASDVVFDGNGLTIDGVTGGTGLIIKGESEITNITVTNLIINDFSDGMSVNTITNFLFENMTIQNGADDGLFLVSAHNGIVRNLHISGFSGTNDVGIKMANDNDYVSFIGGSLTDNYFGFQFNIAGGIGGNLSGFNITGNTYGGRVQDSGYDIGIIYNNFFNNTNNFLMEANVGGFNTSLTTVTNIMGGTNIGGNYWANYSGTGYSETCSVTTTDYICDNPLNVTDKTECVGCSGVNIDELPLSLETAGVSDEEYPIFYNLTEETLNGTAYVDGANYNFNTTITHFNGSVNIQFNNINYTASNLTANNFNFTISNLGAGDYEYFWWSSGNGTSNNFNLTAVQHYNVAKATPTLNFTINKDGANLTLTYPQQVNVTAKTTIGTVGLDRNKVSYLSNGLNITTGVGEWEYRANISGNQNYSDIGYVTINVTMNEATPVLTFLANGGTENITETYPFEINISAKTTAGILNLTKDGVDYSASNGLNKTLGATSYHFRANVTGGQNYSDIPYINYNVTINKATGLVNLTFNVSSPQNYGNPFTPTCSLIAGEGTPVLELNGTTITSGDSQNLGAGTWNFNCSTNTQNYTANSNSTDFTIDKIASVVNLLLNGTDGNITLDSGSSALLNGTLVTGDVGNLLQLWLNGTQINSAITEVSNTSIFEGNWSYNITVIYPASQNYTLNAEQHFVDTKTTPPPVDTEYPIFSNLITNPANNTAYVQDAVYSFNSTITHSNWTIGIEFDGVNYTASNVTANVFNFSITNLGAGSYNYYWWAYSNGTDGNYNLTKIQEFSVSKATGLVNLTFNMSSPQNYGDSFTPHCSVTAGELGYNLTRNGTIISSGDSQSLGAGNWNFNCSVQSSQNYTANSNSTDFTIDKIASVVNLLLNGTNTNITIGQYNSTLLNGTKVTGDPTTLIKLFNNNVLINENETEVSNLTTFSTAGEFNISVIYPASQNYTFSVDRGNVTVTEAVSVDTTKPWFTTIPANESITYGQGFGVQFIGADDIAVFNYFVNDTTKFSMNASGWLQNTTLLGTDTYELNVTVNDTSGNTNSTRWSVVVSQNTTYVLAISGTTPITYGTTTDVVGSGCPTEISCSLDKANIVYGAGTETFNYSTSGNQNYTKSSITKDIIINQATTSVYAYITGVRNNRNKDNNTIVNLTGVLNTGVGDINLTIDNVQREFGSSPLQNMTIFIEGTYIFSVNNTGNQNYTADGESWTITVTNYTAPVASTGGTIISVCRYKKLAYYNTKLPWLRQVGCL